MQPRFTSTPKVNLKLASAAVTVGSSTHTPVSGDVAAAANNYTLGGFYSESPANRSDKHSEVRLRASAKKNNNKMFSSQDHEFDPSLVLVKREPLDDLQIDTDDNNEAEDVYAAGTTSYEFNSTCSGSKRPNRRSIWLEGSHEWRKMMIDKYEKCICMCGCDMGLPFGEKSWKKQQDLVRKAKARNLRVDRKKLQSVCIYRLRDNDVCECFCRCDVGMKRYHTNDPNARIPYYARKTLTLEKDEKMVDERAPYLMYMVFDTDDLEDGAATGGKKSKAKCYRECLPKIYRNIYVEAENQRRLKSELAGLKAENETLKENVSTLTNMLIGKKCRGESGGIGQFCSHYFDNLHLRREYRCASLKKECAKYAAVKYSLLKDMNERGFGCSAEDIPEGVVLHTDDTGVVQYPTSRDCFLASGLCPGCLKSRTADQIVDLKDVNDPSAVSQQEIENKGAVATGNEVEQEVENVAVVAAGDVGDRCLKRNLRKRKHVSYTSECEGGHPSPTSVVEILKRAKLDNDNDDASSMIDSVYTNKEWKARNMKSRVAFPTPTLIYDCIRQYPY